MQGVPEKTAAFSNVFTIGICSLNDLFKKIHFAESGRTSCCCWCYSLYEHMTLSNCSSLKDQLNTLKIAQFSLSLTMGYGFVSKYVTFSNNLASDEVTYVTKAYTNQ